MIKLTNLKITASKGENALWDTVISQTGAKEITDRQILRKSVDARKKSDVNLVYTVCFSAKNEKEILKKCKHASEYTPKTEYKFPYIIKNQNEKPVVIVGMGPAGLFAALTLCRAGVKCIIL